MLNLYRSFDLILKCRCFAISGQILAILIANYECDIQINNTLKYYNNKHIPVSNSMWIYI